MSRYGVCTVRWCDSMSMYGVCNVRCVECDWSRTPHNATAQNTTTKFLPNFNVI